MHLSPLHPKPGYEALRKHRWSAAGNDYFVTFKAQRPTSRLATPPALEQLVSQRDQLEQKRLWKIRTWVVMPDHIHALFTLGEAKSLADCLRLFKGPLSKNLRELGLTWQPGFYEHRMRPDEDRLPVFLYVFLNPYRANLLSQHAKWPGYFCAPEDWAWFGPLTKADLPYPEWLG